MTTNRCPECDRRAGHGGFHLLRCRKTSGCTEYQGHGGACTTGTWGPLAQGWAEVGSAS